MSAPVIQNLGERPRILISRLSAIGDVVVTTSVIEPIRERFPGAHLAWMVERPAHEVVEDNPHIDEVIVSNRDSDRSSAVHDVREGFRLAAALRQRRFDVAIDFQGLFRSAIPPWRAGIRHRIGNIHPKEQCGLFYTHRVARPEEPSSRQRCLDLLKPLGIRTERRATRVFLSERDRADARALLAEAPPAPNGYACLIPATTWKQKHWPEAHWAQLARLLWRETGLLPVWMGAANDVPLIHRLVDLLRELDPGVPAFVTAGRTERLKIAIAISEQARIAVTVDTALMHLAVAVGTPTVALCGASAWRGFQDYDHFTIVHRYDTHQHCMPCLHHPTCNMAVTCMRDISPADALQAVSQRLGRPLLVVP